VRKRRLEWYLLQSQLVEVLGVDSISVQNWKPVFMSQSPHQSPELFNSSFQIFGYLGIAMTCFFDRDGPERVAYLWNSLERLKGQAQKQGVRGFTFSAWGCHLYELMKP